MTFANRSGVYFSVPARGKPGKFYLYKYGRNRVIFLGEV